MKSYIAFVVVCIFVSSTLQSDEADHKRSCDCSSVFSSVLTKKAGLYTRYKLALEDVLGKLKSLMSSSSAHYFTPADIKSCSAVMLDRNKCKIFILFQKMKRQWPSKLILKIKQL